MCQLQHLLREQSGRRVKLALVGGRQGEWHYHPFMFFQHQFEPVARLVPIMSTILGKDLPARVCILQNRRVSTSRIPAGRTLGSHTITPYPRNMAHFPHCFCRFVLPLSPKATVAIPPGGRCPRGRFFGSLWSYHARVFGSADPSKYLSRITSSPSQLCVERPARHI